MDVFPLSTATYTVTSLAPGTTYNFSVAALNAIGESGYGDDQAWLSATTDGQRRRSLSNTACGMMRIREAIAQDIERVGW